MTNERYEPPNQENASFKVAEKPKPDLKIISPLTLEEKIEFYGLRTDLANYCKEHFSSQRATVGDMAELFAANNCTLADLMVTALVLAGKVNHCEKTDLVTEEKTITIAAQEEDKIEKKLPHSVENLFQELFRLLQIKEATQ